MVKHKIYDEAKKAIQEHRWLESEKAGHDLGSAAERDWAQSHWRGFFCLRFVEHLRGEVFYEEFGAECFGLGPERLSVEVSLLDTVLEKIRQGAENLDVLCWALHEKLPREAIVNILKAIDLNSRRLPPPIEVAQPV